MSFIKKIGEINESTVCRAKKGGNEAIAGTSIMNR